uniref:Uncharacterized protein n=1 Tax=Selenomonas ruminantium TaxID=971 RepID=Q55008_SELRU|nr:hypothetical protein [Selenomonas ruminantium]
MAFIYPIRFALNVAEAAIPFLSCTKHLKPSFMRLMVARNSSPFTFSTVSVTNTNRAFFSARIASDIFDTCENNFSERRQPHRGHSLKRQKLAFASLLVPSAC